jgi:hypothetical protein
VPGNGVRSDGATVLHEHRYLHVRLPRADARSSTRRTPRDLQQVHTLQNAIKVNQKSAGQFEVPN